MTALIPMYLKTTYKKDPIFKDAKCVFSVYNNNFDHTFDASLMDKARMLDIDDAMMSPLSTGDCAGFIRMGMHYADAVIKADGEYDSNLAAVLAEFALKDAERSNVNVHNLTDLEEADTYFNLYTELAG